MGKRLSSAVALLAVAIAASGATAAQAAPHWYKKNVLVGTAPVTVATKGTLILSALSTTIKCKVSDTEEIWNPASGGAGEDLMTAFTLTGCKTTGSSACPKKAAEVIANGLPWPSRLVVAGSGAIVDEIMKMRLLVRCIPGTVGDEFEGTLSPEVGNGLLVFGPGSGALTDASLNPLTISGNDKLVAPPGKVTAKEP